MADRLVPYVKERGFTHVQFLPVMEHPFFGSWGYLMTGYFAPTSRFGSPAELMSLIDRFHQAGIGVYLDWVPSHFPNDEHALALMDGSPIYEHPDPRLGFHLDWKSCIFDYGRDEVRSFLISSALFWLDKYHADGIRVDAVSSMVYLDYSRPPGEWTPNEHGGRENLEALRFLRELNEAVYLAFPDAQTIAEESTAWPRVSRPTYADGLGFGMKWDMGWMNNTLRYFRHESVHGKHHHGELTFRQMYEFSENFMLSLSHDEVVYGKGSLLDQMPGDYISRFNNLRLLLGYQFALPGKNCSSWATSSGSRRSGTTTASWNGRPLSSRCTGACFDGWTRSIGHTCRSRGCTKWTATPQALNGLKPTMQNQACSPSCGVLRPMMTRW